MIREKTQDELNGIITMIKVKQLKEILQENYVVYKSEDKVKEFQVLGMDSKNNLCIIKTKLDEVNHDSSIMKSRLIEVRFMNEKGDYSEYSQQYETITEYETVGLFNNIDDAWKSIQNRIELYHTKVEQYNFRLIEVNKSTDMTYGEGDMKQKYDNIIAEEKRKAEDELIKGYRCSECKYLYIISGLPRHTQQNQMSSHGRSHAKHGSWQHVDWLKVMKRESKK
jgi:hypothetical protein